MSHLTRPLTTGGPYGHIPGAEPPFHSAEVDADTSTDFDNDGLSRVDGSDDTLATEGWVGYSDKPGADGAAYRGRDLTDPSTWQGRPYNEAPGMISRFDQEMGQ